MTPISRNNAVLDNETEKDIKAMVESVSEVKDNPCTFYSRMPSDVWTKYADCWIEFRKTDIYKKVLEELGKTPKKPTVTAKSARIVIRCNSAA